MEKTSYADTSIGDNYSAWYGRNLQQMTIDKKGGDKMMEYPKYEKVLFCTDYSENSDYALEFAFGIAKRDEGLLYIYMCYMRILYRHLRRVFTQRGLGKDTKSIEEELVNKYKEHYVKKIKNGIRFEIVTKSGRKDDNIIKFAKRKKADII